MDAGHGSRLSDYKIGSTLGKGRFAVVKAAVHLPTGRPCAVKIIDKPPSGSASALKVRRAFQNEVALLYSVRDHPNVLHIFAHFETPSKYYLVTEQLHGGELWDRISKSLFRPFEEHDAAVHALVIASTLAHLHDPDRAIVHRDLKTPNLVYRAKPTTGRDRYDRIYDPRSLVLGLFGKGDEDWEGPGIMMTRFCGSPLWMAPEIVRGHGYGREVDLWSLGVICYGLLTGIASPLPGLSATGNDYLPLLHPPSGGIDYPSPPLSEAAISFLNGLLCWNPKERMTAGMCLEHKWITDVVGGDWKRWESLVRAWAGKRAADRREAAESPMAIAGLGTGEGEMAGEAGEWRVTEWADIVS
ncbi:kinase-like domain-containing protein [Hyaloraphidium curvatum]|nr:kinase-like domain-containing protein [Hyaloraphidium curvatum]